MRTVTYWAWDANDKGYYVFKPGVGTNGSADAKGNIAGTDDKTKALLFFPAVGNGYETNFYNSGNAGWYWASTTLNSNSEKAYRLYFGPELVTLAEQTERYCGFSVRPISD